MFFEGKRFFMSVTLGDIAKATDLSVSTVSRVINGSALISRDQALRVQRAARKLGYRKRVIRRHKQRAIMTIKLVLPRYRSPLLHQFYDTTELVEGIRKGMQPTRGNLVVEVARRGMDLFAHKKGSDLDSVIFAFVQPAGQVYSDLLERGVPCLTLNRVIRGGHYITGDNEGGVGELVDRLYEANGKLRPAHVTLRRSSAVVKSRQRGVAKACERLGIAFGHDDVYAVDEPSEIDAGFVKKLVKNGCNAVIAFNDLVAVSVLQAARDASVKVPEQLALTGFDDSPVRRLVRPMIASMSMPVSQIAEEAGRWVTRVVVEREAGLVQTVLPGDYCEGETVGENS